MYTPLERVIFFEGTGSAVEMLPSHKALPVDFQSPPLGFFCRILGQCPEIKEAKGSFPR